MMSIKSYVKIIIFILTLSSAYGNQNFLPIPIIKRDSNLLKIKTSEIKINNQFNFIDIKILRNISWERSKNNLILPRVLLRLKDRFVDQKRFHFRYLDQNFFPQQINEYEVTDIEVSLFESNKIEVFENGNLIGSITTKLERESENNQTVLEDYSCSPYEVKVYGFEGEFLSLGCELIRDNVDGVIVPTLNLHWIVSDYKTLDKKYGPYVVSFSEGRSAIIPLINEENKIKEVKFQVNFPERIHRLSTAIALGPYIYKSNYYLNSKQKETLPSWMFYGNYYLNNIHSVKFFNALIMKESVFNHAGIYLGSELGKFYDDRLVFNSLLGFQALSFRFDRGQDDLFTQTIYPQGLEIVMHHPWDLRNYKFSIGGFLSPQSDVTYQNFWARFGSRLFLEFNYINWQYKSRSASMYGLSIGWPFFKAF